MYDDIIKTQYIESVSSEPDFKKEDFTKILMLFQVSEEYEIKLGKDLAYFDLEEMTEIYLAFKCTTNALFSSLRKTINKYIKWYKQEVDANICILTIPSSVKRKIILQGEEDYVFHIEDNTFMSLVSSLMKENYIQTAYIVMAAYIGLSGSNWSEITLAKKRNIDFDTREMKVYGYNKKDNKIFYSRTITVSDLFLRIVKMADAEKNYKRNNGSILGLYKETDFILKDRDTAKQDEDIKSFINRRSKRCIDMMYRLRHNPNYAIDSITLNEIWESGALNFLIKLMQAYDQPISKIHTIEKNKHIIEPVLQKYNMSEACLKKIISLYIPK